MKWVLAVGGLLLASAVPAHAQVGGGVGGSTGHVNFPVLPNCPETQFSAIVVSGTAQDFIPTTYASYGAAMAQGRVDLAAKPKSLGEIAQEYRREPKEKAKFAFEQNEYGQAMVTRR